MRLYNITINANCERLDRMIPYHYQNWHRKLRILAAYFILHSVSLKDKG